MWASWSIPVKLDVAIAYDTGMDKTYIDLTWPGFHLFFGIDGKWSKDAIITAIYKLVNANLLPKADQFMESTLRSM